MAKGSPEEEVVRIVVLKKPDEFAALTVAAVAVNERTMSVAGIIYPRQEVLAGISMIVSAAKDGVEELETDPRARERLLNEFLAGGDVTERQEIFFGAVQDVRGQAVQNLSR